MAQDLISRGQDSHLLTPDHVFIFGWVWGTLSDCPTELACSGWGQYLHGKWMGDLEAVQEMDAYVLYSSQFSLLALME